MNSRDWLYPLGIVACIFWALVARHHARKAADALREGKAAIAQWALDAGIVKKQPFVPGDDLHPALAERQAGERKRGSF